jgi:hypothetical protein
MHLPNVFTLNTMPTLLGLKSKYSRSMHNSSVHAGVLSNAADTAYPAVKRHG